MINLKKYTISVVGLGYVGLPLAIEFGKKTKVIGYDSDKKRIISLNKGIDLNNELKKKQILKSKYVKFTNNIEDLNESNIHIIAVPTPVNKKNIPDLKKIKFACKNISKVLKKNDIVIFESTGFPGLTEEVCIPIIEKISKLNHNKDFYSGYSPERINPGDKKNTLTNIVKITSGSNPKTSKTIDNLYKAIIKKGTFLASSIKVAEAAKVIENAQRDINIAFINELSIIFDKFNINTNEVLQAASTKWNFLNFYPGLVGGHCIGVDPYYLSYKSKMLGYNPKIISSGRKINDNYYKHISNKIYKTIKYRYRNQKLKVLILGATFKENCSDFRNSKSIFLYNDLIKKKIEVDIFDPLVDQNLFNKKTNITINRKMKLHYYHLIILAVSHKIFIKMGERKIKKSLIKNGIFFDFKNTFKFNNKNIYI